VLAQAKAVLETARNVDELKMAQAVVLPLELGLTLRQTAAAIGVSPGWVCRLRRRFERIVQGEESPKQSRGGRRRGRLTPEQEAAFLAPYLEEAKAGGGWWCRRSRRRWSPTWAGRWRSPPSIGCCTARAGASWRRCGGLAPGWALG
jgi:hypothetical protein